MGFGKMYSSAATNIQNEFSQVQAAQQENAMQSALQSASQNQAASAAAAQQQMLGQEASAQALARSQMANAVGAGAQKQNAALGILDYIHTTPQGLLNAKSNTGKLTILGN